MSTFEQEKERRAKKDYAYQFYLNRGLTPKDSAAIVGNLYAESGLDTTVKGAADQKGSVGVGQWHSERKKGLYDFAKSQGKNWSDLDVQLDYVLKEGQTTYKNAFDKMRNAKTVEEATMAFMNEYERPAEWAKKQSWGVRSKTALGLSGMQADPNFTAGKEFSAEDSFSGPEYNLGDAPTMEGKSIQLDKSTTEVMEEPKEVVDAKESINDKSFIQDLYSTLAQQQQQIEELQKGPEQTKEEQIQEQYSSEDMKDPYNYIDFTPTDLSQYQQPEPQQEFKIGGVIDSNRGQWDFPGEITRIKTKSGHITMGPDPISGKELTQPLLGIDNFGNKQKMFPGGEYRFPGNVITEYPTFQIGGFKLKDERDEAVVTRETIPNIKPKIPVQLKKKPANVPTIDTLMAMRPDLTKDQGIYYGTGDDTTYVSPNGKLSEVVVKAWKKPSNEVDLKSVKTKDDAIALQKKLVESGYDLGQYGTNKDGVDGQIGNVTRNALKSYNEIAKYQEEYNKSGKKQKVEDYIIDKLGKRNYNKRELELFRDSSYLTKRPDLMDDDVKKQVEVNRQSGNIDSNYVVISDKNSRGYVFDKNNKLIKSFKNITGKDTGEDTKINSRTWVSENPGKNFTDYVDYLEKTKQKYTPSGVYFVGKKDEDYSGLKSDSFFGKALIQGRELLGNLGLSTTNDKRRAIREHSYGNVGLIGLKKLSGTGIGEAMHSTGTSERTENLTGLSTTKNRKMSSGCINVGNEDMQYCMDNLEHDTPIFLLREDGKQLSPGVLKYKNASKPEREIANGLYNNYEKLKEDFGPETDNYINYSTGILGNESSWGNMSIKGEVKEAAAQNTLVRSLLGKKGDASVGAAQIKWSGISPETKLKLAKFGINNEGDLKDNNKSAIAAMYFLKEKVASKGENLDEGIKSYLGSKNNSSKVRHYIRKVRD